MDSILTSVKKLLGIEEEYTHFDADIIMGINSALMSLNQLGVGPTTGLVITDSTTTWDSVLVDRTDLEGIKLYVVSKTKLAFDPPANSFLVDAIERQIKELEWRINVQAESTIVTEVL